MPPQISEPVFVTIQPASVGGAGSYAREVMHTSPGRAIYVAPAGSVQGRLWRSAAPSLPVFDSIQDAIDAAVSGRGDVIYIAPGDYAEAVVIGPAMTDLKLIGLGSRGAVAIVPTGTNPTALLIDGTAGAANRTSDIEIINIGCEASGTGIGCHIRGNIRRIRLYGCKLESGGAGTALRIQSLAAGAPADNAFYDVELAWSATAAHIQVTGGGDPVTQTYFEGGWAHNFTSRGIHVDTVHTTDLKLRRFEFGRLENDTEPTNEYILADVASSTGLISDCTFPAAQASGKISLATGVRRAGNRYTDGWLV